MMTPVAWMNGHELPFTELSLPVWDLGVVAGASITEMARTFAHQPFRLVQHLQRLVSSCDEIGFVVPWSVTELQQAAEAIIRQNTTLIKPTDDLGVVMFVTAGANRTYLGTGPLPGPTVAIHTFPLPFELWKHSAVHGVRLRIPARQQIETHCLPVHLKIRNRLHWWLADREADAMESGSRALLLDSRGCITETSTSCFYAVIDGEILTPESHVLNSLSRQMVQEAADFLRIPFRRADLKLSKLSQATEVFLSSTPVGTLSVQAVDDVFFPVNAESSVATKLRSFWKKETGIDPVQQILDSRS